MAQVYFTATKDKKAARIVAGSAVRADWLKALLEEKGVQCGGTFDVGPSFSRSPSEARASIRFLNLIL